MVKCAACSGCGWVYYFGLKCLVCNGTGRLRVEPVERLTITPGMPFVPTPIPDIFRPVVFRELLAQPDREECE